MKNYLNNSILYESGVYYKARSFDNMMSLETRKCTLRRLLSRKLRKRHTVEGKIKIAASLLILATMLTMVL